MKYSILIFCLISGIFSSSFTTQDIKRIVIDIGHGGEDPGCTNGPYSEKEIVLEIGKKIKALNQKSNIKIILLREDDQFLSSEDRVAKINDLHADLVISLHINVSKSSKNNGFEIVISEKNIRFDESLEFAMQLEPNLSSLPIGYRGISRSNSEDVLKSSNCPAVLVEMGFISNEKDKKYIVQKAGQTEVAEYIVASL